MKVSAVIPTRNREFHLRSLLKDFQRQTYPVAELIIVDSSDDKSYKEGILKEFSSLPIVWLDARASVCIQRNKGIKLAASPWIFLCDDDMQFAANYMAQLVSFAEKHADCSCVSGLIVDNVGDQKVDDYSFKKFSSLLWAYIFKLPVWGGVDELQVSTLLKPVYKYLCRYYGQLGNGVSDAGWPVLTRFDRPYFKTSVHPLGASLTKKECLERSPFEEVLDPSGLGDNYGVAMGFAEEQGIYVTHEASAYNARAQENRLDQATAYFRRVLALHFFLCSKARFRVRNRLWFVWSLLGNQLLFITKRRSLLAKANCKAVRLIITRRNPYLLAAQRGEKVVKPIF